MSARARTFVLYVALVILIPGFWRVAVALPPFGSPTSPYGQTVNALLPALRNVSNMVAAVNFDVRGFDTVGEELMLLAATTGATVLLRGRRGEDMTDRAGRIPGRPFADRSDATALICRVAAVALWLFGLYMILHGTVTPGGGFQGGVIVASSLILVYLGEGYAAWRSVTPHVALAALEGGGAVVFVAAAAAPLFFGKPALTNVLPFGAWKDLYSGGLMLVGNGAVGAAVTGSFGLILLEFMEETRSPKNDDLPDEAHR